MEGISCFNGGGGCFSDGEASFLSRGIGFGEGGGGSFEKNRKMGGQNLGENFSCHTVTYCMVLP